MEEFIRNILNSDQAGISILLASFLLGVFGAITSCCNAAIIGVVIGYSGAIGTTREKKQIIFNGVFFMIGSMVSMAIIGGITGYASELLSNSFNNYWTIVSGIIAIFFGLITLDLLPVKIPEVKFKKKHSDYKGTLPSVIFGLSIGGLSVACNSCCNPVFPIILATSFLKGSIAWGFSILTAFAIGYGLPNAAAIIGIGLGIEKISNSLAKFNQAIKYAAGTLLIIIGFYFLISL